MASQEEDNKLEYISNVNKEQEIYYLNVYKKYESILNDKSEKFERKVHSLIEVWKSIAELNFSLFDIKYIIQIIDWAKLHALNIVLTGEWRSIKECFRDDLLGCIDQAQMSLASVNDAFSTRCQKLANVVKKPWEDPVLYNLIQEKDAEIGSKEIEFFCVETAYLVSVRLKKLCENHCEDLALNLVTNFLKYKKQAALQNLNLNATETQLWFIFDIYIALLYKFQDKTKILEQFQELQIQEGVQLIKRFAKKRVKISKIWRNCHKIAIFGSRYFLSNALMKYNDNLKESLTELLKTYLALSNTDALLQEFVVSVRNLTNLADAEGLCIMCEIIHKEAAFKLRHFAIEMYIRALTTDMNELERLKHANEDEKMKLTTSRLALTFTNLADLLNDHVKVARECVLTAFSLEPTKERLKQIEELAKRSGFPVLDTGQEWKCRLHPPVLPSDDVAWVCPECGEWMCKPELTAPLQMNTPLQEALQESVLGISEALCDDLVVCLSNPRYQILSWLLSWGDLYRLCILYLNDPEKTKNFVTELKFVDVDYSMFEHIKREPVDEYTGIEKGYEQYLDLDFVSDEETSSVSEDSMSHDKCVGLGSDGTGESYLPIPQSKSDPNTLKSLRMFRPNLKRKKEESESPTKEKKALFPMYHNVSSSSTESIHLRTPNVYLPDIAGVTTNNSRLNNKTGNFSHYKYSMIPENSLVNTQLFPSRTTHEMLNSQSFSASIISNPVNSVFDTTNLSSVMSTSYVSNIIKSSLTFGVPKVTTNTPSTSLQAVFNQSHSPNFINKSSSNSKSGSFNTISKKSSSKQSGSFVIPSSVQKGAKPIHKNQTEIRASQMCIAKKSPRQMPNNIANDLDALLKEVIRDIEADSNENNPTLFKEVVRNIDADSNANNTTDSKNGIAATLPQLGGQVASNHQQLIQVPHQQCHHLNQIQTKLLPETSSLNGTNDAYKTRLRSNKSDKNNYNGKSLSARKRTLSMENSTTISHGEDIFKIRELRVKIPRLNLEKIDKDQNQSRLVDKTLETTETTISQDNIIKELLFRSPIIPLEDVLATPLASLKLKSLLIQSKPSGQHIASKNLIARSPPSQATLTKLPIQILQKEPKPQLSRPRMPSEEQEMSTKVLQESSKEQIIVTKIQADSLTPQEIQEESVTPTKVHSVSCTPQDHSQEKATGTEQAQPLTHQNPLEAQNMPIKAQTRPSTPQKSLEEQKIAMEVQPLSLASQKFSEGKVVQLLNLQKVLEKPVTPIGLQAENAALQKPSDDYVLPKNLQTQPSAPPESLKEYGTPMELQGRTSIAQKLPEAEGPKKNIPSIKIISKVRIIQSKENVPSIQIIPVSNQQQPLTVAIPQPSLRRELLIHPQDKSQSQTEVPMVQALKTVKTALSRESPISPCPQEQFSLHQETVQMEIQEIPPKVTSKRLPLRLEKVIIVPQEKVKQILSQASMTKGILKITPSELQEMCLQCEKTVPNIGTSKTQDISSHVNQKTVTSTCLESSPNLAVATVDCDRDKAQNSDKKTDLLTEAVQNTYEDLQKTEQPGCSTVEGKLSSLEEDEINTHITNQMVEEWGESSTQNMSDSITSVDNMASDKSEQIIGDNAANAVAIEVLANAVSKCSTTKETIESVNKIWDCDNKNKTDLHTNKESKEPVKCDSNETLEELEEWFEESLKCNTKDTIENRREKTCVEPKLDNNSINIVNNKNTITEIENICATQKESIDGMPSCGFLSYEGLKEIASAYMRKIPASESKSRRKKSTLSNKSKREIEPSTKYLERVTNEALYLRLAKSTQEAKDDSKKYLFAKYERYLKSEEPGFANTRKKIKAMIEDIVQNGCNVVEPREGKHINQLLNDDPFEKVHKKTKLRKGDRIVAKIKDEIFEFMKRGTRCSPYILDALHPEHSIIKQMQRNDARREFIRKAHKALARNKNIDLCALIHGNSNAIIKDRLKAVSEKCKKEVTNRDDKYHLFTESNSSGLDKENIKDCQDRDSTVFDSSMDMDGKKRVPEKLKSFNYTGRKPRTPELKIYSNSRKRKHDGVPCFKLDQEKNAHKSRNRRLTVALKRLPEVIARPNVTVLVSDPFKNDEERIDGDIYKKTSPLVDCNIRNEVKIKLETTNYNKKQIIKNKIKKDSGKKPDYPEDEKYLAKNHGVHVHIYEDKFYSMIAKVYRPLGPCGLNGPVQFSIPGLHDYSEILPKNVNHVVNVVQHSVPRSSTVSSQNTQTSTQVTPHIQRIGQPKLPDRKPNHYEDDVEQLPSSSTIINAPSTSQSCTTKPGQKSLQSRQTPNVNILSQQILRPTTCPVDMPTATVIKVESEDHPEVQATKTVNTNVKIVTTTTQAGGGTTTTSAPAQGSTILQFICKSSSLPKFQQAFGKAVYQPGGNTNEIASESLGTSTNDNSSQPQTATVVETKKIAAKALPVNVQPITGNVIFRGQVPVGQTVSLIPPGSNTRQLFRITGSTHEQISLVKETVIQNKMSALLAAALQGKPKITEQNGELVEEYSATRITLCRPGTVPPNATRIVKPVHLQIPANVIRAPQPNVSSTTLEQLREFDMVYKQVKERSGNPNQTETSTQSSQESPQQQRISFTYVNQVQKYTQLSPVVVVSSYSPIQQTVSPALTVTSQAGSGTCQTQVNTITVPKVAVKSSKGKSIKSSVAKTSPTAVPAIPKPQQKPQEDEHTTQRIFDILAEYAEQLRNSPDLNNKPAPRRRSNPPTNPNSTTSTSSSSKKKKKKSSSSTTSNLVETDNEDLTMGSEDSSGGNVVHLSMTDEEQSQSASITPPESNLEPASINTSTPRPLIVTDSSNQPRNVIIADSSVGEALKMPNTALLMPGNYIMPVSVVKGGQQIAVVSGGSKILTTVPARSGQNMLLFQSFVNQSKKGGISAVKYSTLQPFSGISSQNVAGVNPQSPVVLPSNSVATVALGQPITLKKIDDSDRGNNTELLLTISQPRESIKMEKSPDIPQPDSSTNLSCEAIEVKIEDASQNDSPSAKVFNSIQKTNSVATSVIASVIKKEDDGTDSGTGDLSSAKVEEPSKQSERIGSVLVNASTSNGPMLSHASTRYRKPTEGVESITTSTKEFSHSAGKISQPGTKIFKNNAVYYAIRTKKAINKKVDSEMQKQAAIERELRLQKTLSEECEDLGVDEPSTSDLFPEADLLFDSNHSPSYDQSGQRIQGTETKAKDSLHLFSDDENSGPLRSDLFDYVEYHHPPETGTDQTNGNNASNESVSSCDDSTLLPNCSTMSEVTLNSPISPGYSDSSHAIKYKYKYSNRKKGDKAIKLQPENWQDVTEVTSSEDTMELVKEDETPVAIQEETVIEEAVTEVEAVVMEHPKDPETEVTLRCPIHNSVDSKGSRKTVKKTCSCINGSRSLNVSSAKKRVNSPKSQCSTVNKKLMLGKKR